MDQDIRLCRIVQGVEFIVDEQGVMIRGLIVREALENYFGASTSPQSWLQAYRRNRDAIDCAAADLYRANPSNTVVVLHGDRPSEFAQVRLPGQAGANIGNDAKPNGLPASRCGGI